ncbi:MAG: FeoA family protein [Thermodesulfovibrionales bacterium]
MKADKKGRDQQMFPLGLLSAGEKAEVMQIREGNARGTCSPDIHRPDGNGQICRMEDMGLRAGKEVEMLNSRGTGAMLIKIDESRIAIGRGMAMKIMVRRKGQ